MVKFVRFRPSFLRTRSTAPVSLETYPSAGEARAARAANKEAIRSMVSVLLSPDTDLLCAGRLVVGEWPWQRAPFGIKKMASSRSELGEERRNEEEGTSSKVEKSCVTTH